MHYLYSSSALKKDFFKFHILKMSSHKNFDIHNENKIKTVTIDYRF